MTYAVGPIGSGFCELRASKCDCPLKPAQYVPVEGQQHGGGVVLVGEAGGVEEAGIGPFVGRSGQRLRVALSQIAVPIDAIYNMVPRSLYKHKPTVREVAACWECHVQEWLVSLQPSLIIACGGTASEFLAGQGVRKSHGSNFPCIREGLEGVPVFVTYHPAATLHDPRTLSAFEGDYTALEAYYLGQERLTHEGYTVGTVADIPTVVGDSRLLFCDLETSSLIPENGTILGISLRDGESGNTYYLTGEPSEESFEILMRNRTVWYNGVGFDLKWFPVRLRYSEVDDVLLMARILQKPYGSLRALAAYEYGIQHDSIGTLISRLGLDDVNDLDLDDLAFKAGEDVELTHKLFDLYKSELYAANLWHIYLLERKIAPLVRRLEDNGMLVDTTRAQELYTRTVEECNTLITTIQSQAPLRKLEHVSTSYYSQLYPQLKPVQWHELEDGTMVRKVKPHKGIFRGRVPTVTTWYERINPRSDDQLVEAFLASGINLTKRTKSDTNYSVDGEVLEGLDHPLASMVRDFRKVDKRRQFVRTLSLLGDGVLHVHLRQLGTVTGRFSSGSGEETEQ